MKSARLSYHRSFPWTPVSGRAGARGWAWKIERMQNGEWARPVQIVHPFMSSVKLWCLLQVEFQGVELRFATPAELDHVCDILLRNPMPSGRSLVPECAVGRPNGHWLSRLPSKAKPWRFRQALLTYLARAKPVAEFRAFYKDVQPVQIPDTVFDSFEEAQRARRRL